MRALRTLTHACLPFRRHVERQKLEREKQLRLESEQQKTELEQRLLQYQDEIRLAQEALVSGVSEVALCRP